MTYLPEAAVRAALYSRVLTVQLLPGDTAWAPHHDHDFTGPLVVQYILYVDGDIDCHVLPAFTVKDVLL